MKQGIEKIMQERWGFAHHQKTMLVDQDWHGQRYLTAYMGMRFQLSNVALLVIGLLYMVYPDVCRPQIRLLPLRGQIRLLLWLGLLHDGHQLLSNSATLRRLSLHPV